MPFRLDIRQWNLALPLSMMTVACGPRLIPIDGDTDGTGTTSSGPGTATSPTTTTSTTGPAPECKTDSDCGYNEYCVNGECRYYGCYDYCCGQGLVENDPVGCSPPGYYDCYSDADCGPLEQCVFWRWYSYCEPVPQPAECGAAPGLLPSIPLPAGTHGDALDLQFTDADGNAAQDLVIAYDGGAQVVLGPGVDPPVDLPVGQGLSSPRLSPGDFDGDADEDIAIGGQASNFGVALNDGAGSYSAVSSTIGSLTGLVSGDIDADGLDDLVGLFGSFVQVLVSAGDGTFAAGGIYGQNVSGLRTLQIDGQDGTDLSTIEDNSSVVQRLAQGGALDIVDQAYLSGAIVALAAPDLDGDGDEDLVALDRRDGWDYLHLGISESGVIYWSGSLGFLGNANTIVAGDFDGDGKDDVALVGSDQYVEVYYHGASCHLPHGTPHSGVVAAAGDLDGDGSDELVISNGVETSVLSDQ